MKNIISFYRSASVPMLVLILLALAAAEPIKFHPIGDSTTEAYELETAWRYWLCKKLVKNGFDSIDFVGSRQGTNQGTDFTDNDWDMDHDGHTSSRAQQVLEGNLARDHKGSIKEWAPEFKPHIAVIYLGTNDIRGKRATPDIMDSFKGIIQVLREARPEVKVVMCQIPYWNYGKYGGSQSAVDALNAEIPSLIDFGTQISPIKIVDLNTDYEVSDHRDGIHPGPTGAPKIADRVYEAIVPWLSGNTGILNLSRNFPGKPNRIALKKSFLISNAGKSAVLVWIPEKPGSHLCKGRKWSILGKPVATVLK